jgi:hypothetical protein
MTTPFAKPKVTLGDNLATRDFEVMYPSKRTRSHIRRARLPSVLKELQDLDDCSNLSNKLR